jgi:hypothetical protein
MVEMVDMVDMVDMVTEKGGGVPQAKLAKSVQYSLHSTHDITNSGEPNASTGQLHCTCI